MRLTGFVFAMAGTAVLAGCAANVPSELADARRAYLQASEGPAAKLAMADLRKAEDALATAEKSFDEDADSYKTRDLSYVAQRKSEMAAAQASINMEQNNKTRSDKDFQTTQGDLLKERTDDLNDARTALAVSETSDQANAARISAEQRGRVEAEKKTAQQGVLLEEKAGDLTEARAALAASERSGQVAEAQVSVEQKARTDAEVKAAQQAMQLREQTQDLNKTKTALAVSEKGEQVATGQLAVEQTARLDAEKKTAEALAALSKLAAVKEEARGTVITLSGSVLFRSGEATLMAGAESRLDQVVDALASTDGRNLVVEGYTDSQGSDQSNLDLSQRRADSVRDYMIRRGYNTGRIEARGIGEARPIADNATSEGRANNRRVEIVLQHAAK